MYSILIFSCLLACLLVFVSKVLATGGWGHKSRFPWKRLPDRMCFRETCREDKHCCLKYNLCDRSAKVCVDCWYGSTCVTEEQCCQKYPYCQTVWKTTDSGQSYVDGGKCVNQL